MRIVFYPLLFILCVAGLNVGCEQNQDSSSVPVSMRIPAPNLKRLSHDQYGIDVDHMQVIQANFERNQYLRDVLVNHSVSSEVIDQIAKKSVDVFDVRKMREGRPYTLIKSEAQQVQYFIYEKNESDYVVFDLTDSVRVYEGHKRVAIQAQKASCVVESSLYDAIEKEELPVRLGILLEDIFAWSVDFFHLEKGDYFKVIYEEKFVDGYSIGISDIVAAEFFHDGEMYYAFRFDDGDTLNYYNYKGRPINQGFLKSPLKIDDEDKQLFGERISPILGKRRKNHKGVTYFGKEGAEVHALADGKIERARFRSKSGNYVRISHSKVYTTQYQHLSRFADSLKEDSVVNQGDLIGYVGKTGAVSRPQLVLRVWKNGREINPLEIETTPSEALEGKEMEAFTRFRQEMTNQLRRITLPEPENSLVSNP